MAHKTLLEMANIFEHDSIQTADLHTARINTIVQPAYVYPYGICIYMYMYLTRVYGTTRI